MKALISGHRVEGGLALSLSRAFSKSGCEVAIFDDELAYKRISELAKNRFTHRLLWRSFSVRVQSDFIRIGAYEKPDIILVLKGWFFRPETIIQIKKEHPDLLLFCFNTDNPFNTWHFGSSNIWIRKSIAIYDSYLIWSKFLIEPLRLAGARKVEYLPFGYDPELHFPVSPSAEEKKKYGNEIVFIGSWDEEREWWLNQICDYPVTIWGNAWQKARKKVRAKWKGRAVFGEDFSNVCNSSKIVLNFIRKQNIPAHNMRTFEVPACKGFMLTTRTNEQCEFFEENKEIACFSNPNELREKLDYYLSNDDRRKDMVEKAFQKVQKHTYYRRVRKILEIYAKMKKS